jgi:hypothetical protein
MIDKTRVHWNSDAELAYAKKKQKFNPSREYLNEAVNEYLQRGGKIKVTTESQEWKDYRDYQAIHDFLTGA